MNSTYEFGIYLTHFCNVDLFRQGLYFFRIGLYYKTNKDDEEKTEMKHYALPYRTMIGKQHERDFLIRSKDRVQSMGHIDDITSTYCSSVFRVQFQEQKVRLNEGCLFRLDLPYEPKHRVYIDIELVFCELHASDYKNKGFPTFEDFTIVDKSTLCSENSYNGLHSMYPVSFSTSHFCLVHVMVHAELINFKFIPAPAHYKLIEKYRKLNELNGKNVSSMNHHLNHQHVINDKINKIKKIKNGTINNENNININNTQNNHINICDDKSSFAEVLFYDRVDCILTEKDWKMVSEHHLFYVYCLLYSYSKLRKLIHEYIDKYFDSSNICHLQTEFDALYPINDIELESYFTENKSDDKDVANNNISIPSLINCSSQNVLSSECEELRIKYGLICIRDRFTKKQQISMTGRSICHLIGEDVHLIAGQLFRIWHFLLSIIPRCNNTLCTDLIKEWESSFIERWGAVIFRERLSVRARLRVVSTSLSEHEMISRKVRSQSTLSQLEAPPLQDIIYMISSSQQEPAVIFEQSYNLMERESINNTNTNNNNNIKEIYSEIEHKCCGKHMFVLVHGYQGNSWDMRMFRNHLLCKCPSDLFLMSESNENEGNTEGDITEMGQRLAQEILTFIDVNIIQQRHKLCRISFITHSLGGIIAREAIANPLFSSSPYIFACYTFISLAVCHCGYLFGRSKALQAGFALMRSWKKSLCLSQLSLTDNENPRKTYIYKLSKKESLKYFKNVLLVSSPEDRYTPYHSTRIEMHRKTVQDTKWGRIYNEMVRNLLRPLDHVNITRFDVSFSNRNKKRDLDSIIGRSAHICFLEQPLYIDMLIHVYKKYFINK